LVRACGVSDIGRVRKTNEDALVSDPEVRLFAVADGMGGHGAGEVASRLAIEAISGFIRRSAADTDFSWPYGIDRNLSMDGNRLRTAIHLANRRIFRSAENNDDYNGMGTTIVGLLVNGSRISIGHVGDSRMYLLGNGTLEQLTHDDSWAATILAHDPRLAPSDIANHPMRNVLTNVLGARETVDIHMAERDLTGGEMILLCSDGLHGVLDNAAVTQVMSATPDVDTAARQLVETAIERGSRDNVTALVVKYERDS
jgi:serine/threonine protein phosphatase PrpC